MSQWTIIEMNPPESREWNFEIPYVGQTPNYGRAEFSVCIRWKRGRITDLWISPAQQPTELGKMYHINVTTKSTGLHLSHGAHVWIMNWCKEHKAQNFNVYVPADDSDTLRISLLSTVGLMFTRRIERSLTR